MSRLLTRAKCRLNAATHRMYTMPVLVLMPHSRCNCRCVMCDIWRANKNRKELSEADLQPHIDDLKRLGVEQILLSGGEALMHSNLWRFIRQIEPLGARITLLSTGLLLERNAENVLRWCDDVIVSLDGSRAVHNAIRNVPRAYERLQEGVAALKAKDDTFPVTARCVLQKDNFRDLPNIIDSARTLGVDQISFLAADVSSEAFNRPGGWPEERVETVALSAPEVAEFKAILERCFETHAEAFQSGFVAETPAKLKSLVQYYRALLGEGDFAPVQCNAPWVSAVVEADGAVRPCFFHESYGNIREGPLGSILNGPRAVAFRRQLDVQKNPVCRRCVCSLNYR